MKTYYVAYTTDDHPSEIETEEFDFEDDIPINQSTVCEKIEQTHYSWYDRVSVHQVISWSKVEE